MFQGMTNNTNMMDDLFDMNMDDIPRSPEFEYSTPPVSPPALKRRHLGI